MATEIYVGYPPENINQWVKKHLYTKFDKIVEQLESGLYNDTNPLTIDDIPLTVGTSNLTFKYHVDLLGKDMGYNEPCMVLGYNASIPEYVKYKNGDERIYVKSYKGGEDVQPIVVGDEVFKKKYNAYTYEVTYETLNKTVTSINSNKFTYGNHNTYDVPMSITVDGKEYSFAGYNITFQTKHALKNGDCDYLQFNTYQYKANSSKANAAHWDESLLRKWLNNYSTDIISNGNPAMDLVSLPQKVKDETHLLKNIVGVVNRNINMDKYKDDIYMCTVDKFWLLTTGNVNCNGTNYNDGIDESQFLTNIIHFDTTTVFRNIFQIEFGRQDRFNAPHEQWTRSTMVLNSDGTISDGEPTHWWLRSSIDQNSLFHIGRKKDVNNPGVEGKDEPGVYYVYNALPLTPFASVLPAFTIG